MKKKIIRIVSVLLCVLSLTGTLPAMASHQDYTELPDVDITGLDAAGIVDAFLTAYKDIVFLDKVAIAYRNMVTGEEYFLNGDMYLPSASLYKVPLNMYWAEKVYNGEITMEEDVMGAPLKYAQEESLVFSSNTFGAALHNKIGKYGTYRTAVAPYLGLTEKEAQEKQYLTTENLTARQMLCCMDLLYKDPDRYPGVLDCLKQASPGEYFRTVEDRYTIAQKYGYLDTDKYGSIVNCAGIVYAEQPFLLVVMTSLQKGLGMRMGILVKFLCDYAAACAAEMPATPEPTAEPTASPEPTAAPKATAAPTTAPTAAPTAAPTTAPTVKPDAPAPTPSPAPAAEKPPLGTNDIIFWACAAVAAFCVIRLITIFAARKKRRRH